MENVRKHRDIRIIKTEERVSERNYHTTKFFSENVFAIAMKKNHKYL